MKVLALIILLLLFAPSATVHAQNDNLYFGTLMTGFSNLTGAASLNFSFKHRYFLGSLGVDAYFNTVSSSTDTNIVAYSLFVGPSFSNKHIITYLASGLSVLTCESYVNSLIEPTTKFYRTVIGLPIKAHFSYIFCRYFALGVEAYLNLNPYKSVYGGKMGLDFGRLR